ncbi:MAG TPA: DUF2232 domain-containing protein [Gemmatimonadaceae bacterium]|jgi:hypothetical protein|nr:DUF2232 domain-containing protein [Gemmatimonadaceae bacterium]
MQDAEAAAPSERGWGKLLLALVAFLIIPPYTPLRALLPVEDTFLLLLPALAACCLVGWWAGGRLMLAITWVGLAAWMLAQPAPAGAFYNLVRGWTLLLAGSFGLVCLFGTRRPFFSRALSAASLALTLVLLMSTRGPLTPSRAKLAVQAEFARRNTEAIATFRAALKQYPDVVKSMPQVASLPNEFETQLRVVAETGTRLFPSLLLLESLVALALAWGIYHRISRTRLGAPLGFLKDFRFNDQFVWGLIAGITIVLVPAFDFLDGAGRNLLVFFGALYAIRGFGVLSWFLAPGALAAALLVGFAMLWWPVLNAVAVLGFLLLALAAFGLGLGDTWADWRSRARPTT